MLPGSGSFQEIEQLPRSGQIAGSHLPPCHPDASLWHVGLQGQPLLEQFRRLVVDGEMLELGGQTDTQTGMVGESLQRVPAELPGLLEITETQELPVGLEAADSGEAARRYSSRLPEIWSCFDCSYVSALAAKCLRQKGHASMIRFRPRGMIGMKMTTNQSRVSYDSRFATRWHE